MKSIEDYKNDFIIGPIITENMIQGKIHPEIINSSCWIWKRSYPKRIIKHFFKISGGIIPEEKDPTRPSMKYCICHKCDNINGPCVNPTHLFLGTNTENVKDAVKKNRFYYKMGMKLSEETKQKIKDKRKLQIMISHSKEYNNNISNGVKKSWESISEEEKKKRYQKIWETRRRNKTDHKCGPSKGSKYKSRNMLI